jgi:DNA-binding Xre family transcriptional regulator
MLQARSRLKRLLRNRKLTVSELRRKMASRGLTVNPKSLYRLARDEQPIERLDLRVAAAICEVCEAKLTDLIEFEQPQVRMLHLSDAKQQRLDRLMTKNNLGRLKSGEQKELNALVREAEEITTKNARFLVEQQRRLVRR